ncbi:MAG: glycoside hydrolase family 127 protein, partial [Planctomycetaceae bacterium]|nr:glycoside hydrolase family 127 protein [Planctomycetaceae bacterium]
GDTEVLPLIDKLNEKSFNWSLHFAHFPWTDPETLPTNFGSDGSTSHGYTIAKALKYPALRYELTGDPFYRRTLAKILDVLDKSHGQIGGRYAADEHLAGRRPTQGTELCTIVLFMNSLERSFLTFGDPRLLDRLELLAFNALPGGMTADCWAHQYDQQANQVVVSVAERDWQSNDRTANIYGLMPNYPCCLVGLHQGWPRYVQQLWLKTPDGGLCAAALGPSEVQTQLSNGTSVTIRESTEYPFDGEIDFEVNPSRPAAFPLSIRVPGWSAGASVSVNGVAAQESPGGEFVRLEREWRAGDTIHVELAMPLQLEQRPTGAVAVRRGPLYFALRMGKQYERITFTDERNAISIPYQGSVDWQIYPTTDWNYGLLVTEQSLPVEAAVERHAITGLPFADRGEMVFSADRGEYQPWEHDAPVIISLPAQQIANWQLRNHSADDPPQGIEKSGEPITRVQLVPYGSARLRVCEFPLIHVK